jgi:hypothetical protein
MRTYFIWLTGVIAWNFGFPTVPPMADVAVAILLSFASYGLNKFLN